MTEPKVTVKMVDEYGKPAPIHISGAWSDFLNGHWTQDPPTEHGRYLTATHTGKVQGELLVYKDGKSMKTGYRRSAVDELREGFEGWRWSEPFPVVMTDNLPMRQIMRELLADREKRRKPTLTLVPSEG